MTDQEAQREFVRLHREISRLKKKYGVAHDRVVAMETRCHDWKLRAKSAEGSLSELEQDAHRYRWLKRIGCEDAVRVLKPWETEMWDVKIDKARGHIR